MSHSVRDLLRGAKPWRTRLFEARVPLALGVLTFLGLVLVWLTLEPPPPDSLRMATGPEGGAYARLGLRYQELLAQDEIALTLSQTRGSADNLQRLRDKEVDVAFVQAGAALPEDAQTLRALGSLYYEPLWVFSRGAPLARLSELKGRAVAVGAEGSGTRAVALELLSRNGVNDASARLLPLAGAEAEAALLDDRVDALFLVSSPRAEIVQRLAASPQLHLMSFSRERAYTRQLRYLSGVTLSEGMLDLAQNLPARDVRLLAPTANLVVRDDLHPALLSLLLSSATQIHAEGELLEEPNAFPSPLLVQLPLHEDARRYYEDGPSFLHRYLPFWAASTLDRLKYLLLPFVTIFLPLIRVAPPIYQWRIRSRVARWYELLRAIDQRTQAQGSREDRERDLALIVEMEREVSQEEIPTSYMDELYELQVHLNFVRERLERRLAREGRPAA